MLKKDFATKYNIKNFDEDKQKKSYFNKIIKAHYNKLMEDPQYKNLVGTGINKQKEKMRFKLLMGQIMSGNDNKKLLKEF